MRSAAKRSKRAMSERWIFMRHLSCARWGGEPLGVYTVYAQAKSPGQGFSAQVMHRLCTGRQERFHGSAA